MLQAKISFLLLAVVCCSFMVQVGSQGMIAISPPEEEIEEQKPLVSTKGSKKFGGTAEDKEKAEIHKKIAATHLKAAESSQEDDVSRTEEKPGNVVRKDKPAELQNSEKHSSDEWLLHFLLEQYTLTETSEANVEEQVDILQNLEHFAHKFENGRDLFQSTNALKKILLPALNSTYAEIRKAACGVFAVAAQNNAIVQKTALQNGVVRRLVHLLTFDLASVRSKALYGLASLLRNYPEAQKKFILDGGISALVKAASLSETRKRSLNVVTDLLLERRFCRDGLDEGSSTNYEEEISEDEDRCDVNKLLEKSLELNGWCDVLEDSLSNVGGFDTENQILITDAVEAGLRLNYKVMVLRQILDNLSVKYERLKESNVLIVQSSWKPKSLEEIKIIRFGANSNNIKGSNKSSVYGL
ncbi:unnamed protein product [Allacma fusca]|uniref:Nucleotide exchange factor SIL1 n=1 Tax=Allacma fusca TaxID=39272 RepID=A0A8J2LM43_9HEXA|nr:unnamed protein product [Allacma fusca]